MAEGKKGSSLKSNRQMMLNLSKSPIHSVLFHGEIETGKDYLLLTFGDCVSLSEKTDSIVVRIKECVKYPRLGHWSLIRSPGRP